MTRKKKDGPQPDEELDPKDIKSPFAVTPPRGRSKRGALVPVKEGGDDVLKEQIRNAIARKPNATLLDIEAECNRAGYAISPKRLATLKAAVLAERVKRYDKTAVVMRIAEIADRTEALQSELWAIITDPDASHFQKIAAIAECSKLDHKLLAAEMDAGIFERKLGTLDGDIRHEHRLDPERQRSITAALINMRPFGLTVRAVRDIQSINENDTSNT